MRPVLSTRDPRGARRTVGRVGDAHRVQGASVRQRVWVGERSVHGPPKLQSDGAHEQRLTIDASDRAGQVSGSAKHRKVGSDEHSLGASGTR